MGVRVVNCRLERNRKVGAPRQAYVSECKRKTGQKIQVGRRDSDMRSPLSGSSSSAVQDRRQRQMVLNCGRSPDH